MRIFASLVCATGMWMAASACSAVPQPSGFAGTPLSETSFREPERAAAPQEQPEPAPTPTPPQQTPPAEQPARDQTSPAVSGPSYRTPSDARSNQGWFVEPGAGFTASPGMFLTALSAGKFVNHNLAVGPVIQFAVSEDDVFFAPTLNVRGVFDLEGQGLERVKPYAEGGLGLAYVEKDHHDGDDDEWGFLVNVGAGVNFELDRNITLGTGVLFNMMPNEVEGEHFIFSWKVLQLNLYF